MRKRTVRYSEDAVKMKLMRMENSGIALRKSAHCRIQLLQSWLLFSLRNQVFFRTADKVNKGKQ